MTVTEKELAEYKETAEKALKEVTKHFEVMTDEVAVLSDLCDSYNKAAKDAQAVTLNYQRVLIEMREVIESANFFKISKAFKTYLLNRIKGLVDAKAE